MKLSVSLPEEDVETLDRYAESAGLGSRSAALRHAIRHLRHPDLEEQYESAWREWGGGPESWLWDAAAGDGLADAPR